MGGSQTMAARSLLRQEVFSVLPRIATELYGPPQRTVCGNSIIWAGSLSELSGTLRPGPLRRLDLIQRGYCGHWLGVLVPQWISSTFRGGPDTSKRQRKTCQSRGSCWTRIESSSPTRQPGRCPTPARVLKKSRLPIRCSRKAPNDFLTETKAFGSRPTISPL